MEEERKKLDKIYQELNKEDTEYKEMESGACSKSNIIISSDSFCFNFFKNKY